MKNLQAVSGDQIDTVCSSVVFTFVTPSSTIL